MSFKFFNFYGDKNSLLHKLPPSAGGSGDLKYDDDAEFIPTITTENTLINEHDSKSSGELYAEFYYDYLIYINE